MQRNRIGAEGIEDDEVVQVVIGFGQRQSTIPESDVNLGRRVVQIGEVSAIPSQSRYIWIDFVERPMFPWTSVRAEPSGPEPDDGDSSARSRWKRPEHVSDGASSIVVAGGLPLTRPVGALSPMFRCSMSQ